MITNDARCTREMKSWIATKSNIQEKEEEEKEKKTMTRQLDLNLRKSLVKCYIWSIALYCAST